MALLPPGIRKVDEDARDAFRDEARERVAGVFGEHARAASMTAIGEPAVDDARPFSTDLEPDDAKLGVLRQTLEQETAATGSDLELDRARARAHERARVDRPGIGQAGSVGIRIRPRGPCGGELGHGCRPGVQYTDGRAEDLARVLSWLR